MTISLSREILHMDSKNNLRIKFLHKDVERCYLCFGLENAINSANHDNI